MSSYSEGQTHQLMEALEASGFTKDHVRKLGQYNRLHDIPRLLDGKLELVEKHVPAPTIQLPPSDEPLTPPYKGWKLVDDVTTPVGTIELDLAEFLEGDEESVKGEEMLVRAKKRGFILGERHACALLERQDEIPEECRKYYLVFPGTVWRGADGRRYVPYLGWAGGGWYLNRRWLGGRFGRGDRLVVPRT